MTKQDAYRIVYNDILNREIGMFIGKFDATNGDKKSMYGIATVMEFIALETSEQDYEDFQEIWHKNFKESLDKANKE